jgi:UDP-3-O-[3-hydroxymyristoyl] N-acetylglucosamine deacetylase
LGGTRVLRAVGLALRMKAGRQTTLRTSATVSGVGVHSGAPATLNMLPAEPNTGIVFVRLGQNGRPDREVRADARAVTATEFATVIGDAEGPLCSTAEHVLAALTGLGIDNAIIEIDGPEVPIMDGSAAPFVAAIDQAGIVTLSAPRRFIKVLKPVRVAQGEAFGELRPYSHGFRLDIEIEFKHPAIGRQSVGFDVSAETFRNDIARARTFGFMRDVSKLWSAGLALGASLENTICLADDRVVNPEGLRFADEFARHKALDAVGDLAMAGLPILGRYRSVCGGHKLNAAVVAALMADRSAWTVVEAETPRRRRGHAEIGAQVAPAYRADLS